MRLLSLPLLCLLSTALWASRNGDLREHTQAASSIVVGEVTGSRSYYGTDGEIYTDVTIRVSASLKETVCQPRAAREARKLPGLAKPQKAA